jgi:hypothetical protein
MDAKAPAGKPLRTPPLPEPDLEDARRFLEWLDPDA